MEDHKILLEMIDKQAAKIRELEERQFQIWALLFDYNGHYNEKLRKGDIHSLAAVVKTAVNILNTPTAMERLAKLDEELGL